MVIGKKTKQNKKTKEPNFNCGSVTVPTQKSGKKSYDFHFLHNTYKQLLLALTMNVGIGCKSCIAESPIWQNDKTLVD